MPWAQLNYFGFQVLTVVTVNSMVFWVVVPVVRRGPKILEEHTVSLTLKMEATCSSKTVQVSPNYSALKPRRLCI
jgi:hypothetical protein